MNGKPAAAFLAGLFLPLLLCLGYNLVTAGEFVLLTSNGGINFYFGNHSKASGVNDAPTRDFSSIFDQKEAARRLAQADVGRDMKEAEVSSYWRNKGIEEILAQPGAWCRLLIRKIRLFLSNFEYGVIYIPEVERSLSAVQTLQFLPTGILLALGLPGLFLALGRRNRMLGPLLIFLLSSFLTVLLFFMADRFRLPFMAGLLPFAGYFIASGIQTFAHRRYKNLVHFLAWPGLLAAASFLLVDENIRSNQLRRAHITLAKAFLEKDDFAQARTVAMKAYNLGVTPAVLYQLGLIEEAQGNLMEATLRFEDASRLDPYYLEPLGGLARLHERQKNWDQAFTQRQRIIDLVPHRFEAYYNMGKTCAEAGRYEEAITHLKKAVYLAPGSYESWAFLCEVYRLAGKPTEASNALQKAKEIDPERAKGLETDKQGTTTGQPE
jgi:tetratricopeptide (TPR) repeat protein